jgi:hypothetical protein
MQFFSVGDSHVKTFKNITKSLPSSRSTTLYTACQDGTLNLKDQGVSENSVVIISFGEIDVRCRVFQQVQKGIPEEEVIKDIVETFMNKIKEEKSKFQNMTVVYYAGPPISDVPNSIDNPELPRRGTRAQRLQYSNLLVSYMKEAASTGLFLVLDIRDMFRNCEQVLDSKFWDKWTIHINDMYDVFILNEFEKLLFAHKIISQRFL